MDSPVDPVILQLRCNLAEYREKLRSLKGNIARLDHQDYSEIAKDMISMLVPTILDCIDMLNVVVEADARRAAEAAFDRRFPPRVLTEDEARALMDPDEFARWQRRRARRPTQTRRPRGDR